MFIPDDPTIRKKETGNAFHPDLMNDFSSSSESSFTPEIVPEPEKSLYKKYSEGAESFSTGFAKGILKTGKGLGTIGQWLLDQGPGRFVNAATGKGFTPTGPTGDFSDVYHPGTERAAKADEMLTPQGLGENAGFLTERIAEFLIPAAKVSKVSNIAGNAAGNLIKNKAGSTALNLATRGVVEGTVSGATTAVQRNALDNEAKTNALISFVSPTLMMGVEKIGKKMLNAIVKPSVRDLENGFKVENMKKYNLGGSLSHSLNKTSNKLNEVSSQLDDVLETSDGVVDVEDIFNKTVSKLRDKKSLVFGQITDMNGGIDELATDIKTMADAMEGAGNPVNVNALDLKNATLWKRGAGLKGAWLYQSMDKKAPAVDKVYSVFYNELKKDIEKAGGEAIKKYNSQLSDLIPIQSALIRRIPVSDRANVIGMGESMALVGAIFDPKTLVLAFPMLAQKSGRVANFMMNAADSWFTKTAGAGIKTGISNYGQ